MAKSVDPRYQIITQEPYCCVPACIQMVLKRRGLPILDQEGIGIQLGLVVPPVEAAYFNNVSAGKAPPAGWGTRINIRRYGLNKFFTVNKLNLESVYMLPNDFKQARDFIEERLGQNNDLLVCFKYGVLYHNNIPYGHASLIERIDGQKITLVDPAYERKKVTIKDLLSSIKDHRKGNIVLGGIWAIE